MSTFKGTGPCNGDYCMPSTDSSPEPSRRVPAIEIQVPEENKHTSTALFLAEGLCKVLVSFLRHFDSTGNEKNYAVYYWVRSQ